MFHLKIYESFKNWTKINKLKRFETNPYEKYVGSLDLDASHIGRNINCDIERKRNSSVSISKIRNITLINQESEDLLIQYALSFFPVDADLIYV